MVVVVGPQEDTPHLKGLCSKNLFISEDTPLLIKTLEKYY